MLGEKIHQQKDYYQTLLEAQSDLGEGIVIVEDDRIVHANEAFLKISGYAQEELTALPSCFDLLVEEERDSHAESSNCWPVDNQLVVGHYETALIHKSGRRVELECSAKALEMDGRTRLLVLARDTTERKKSQEKLKHSLDALLALYEAGQVLSSTLKLEEVGERVLEIMQRVCSFDAAVINLWDENQQLRVWQTTGPESLWSWAQNTTEAREAHHAALSAKERQLFCLYRSGLGLPPLVSLYLPLRVRDEVIGLLEVYGPQEELAEKNTVRILESLATQAAGALESARLYGDVAERERRMIVMVGRLLGAQEEERRRVAYEVHDSLAQVAASAHQHLQAFASRYPPGSPQAQEELDQVLKIVKQTVVEARKIIANLRPTVLDDFGLASAIRMEVDQLCNEGWQILYEETLGEERLPAALETTLFRVAQEALINVRKHAQSTQVQLSLLHLGQKIRLQVRDFGRGFELSALTGESTPSEKVGVSSMKERVTLLGGEFKIQSKPGAGTLIVVDVPLGSPAATTHTGVIARE